MAQIVKRKRGNETYYYLRHNIRKQKRQKEIYLGKKIPKNIEEIKQNFLLDFYREDWTDKLEKIQKTYGKEKKQKPKSVLKKELKQFSVKFTYNTQRIEGSTLTLKETTDLLEDGVTPKKPKEDSVEAEAHQKLFFNIMKFKKDLSLDVILDWHNKLFKQTKRDIAGKIRNYEVRISQSKFIPPKYQAVPLLLKELF